MTALAIAWAIIGTVTFLGILLEYMERRNDRSKSPLSRQDVWFIPVGLAMLIFGWPIGHWKSGTRETAPREWVINANVGEVLSETASDVDAAIEQIEVWLGPQDGEVKP